MTTEIPETGAEGESPDRPERVIVAPEPDSRLQSLLAEYEQRKTEAEEAETRFRELKAAITSELEDRYQDDDRPVKGYEIPATAYNPAITVSYRTKEYLPAAKIREHFPKIWDSFKQASQYAEVSVSRKGQRRGKRG
jgi:hypothetical protein